MRKPIGLTFALALLLFAQATLAQVSFGEASKFNDDWSFSLIEEDDTVGALPAEKAFAKVDIPHDWSIKGRLSPTYASCQGYLPGGIGWYKKVFTVSDSHKRHYIYFEGVYNRSEVYLNGQLLGKRPNGYASFMYDMTPYLKDGENVLTVRVDHSRSADSRWYTGSGIYRDVWIIGAGDVHFAMWGVGWQAKNISPKSATIIVDAEVEKHADVKGKTEIEAVLTDAGGVLVAKGKADASKKPVTLKVAKPHLWGVDDAYLYKLTTSLLVDGRKIDETSCNVGIRSLAFDADKGFFLNGKSMKVKGVCLHHDAGTLGAAVPEEVWERRLLNLKQIGTNAIRMSHNPQAPVVYDLCDRLGLLVMDEASDEWEFPKRKWLKGWNVGKPGFQGSYDFFEEWIERDVTDMVRRDRNHPSVFLWSIGNEVDYPNDPYSHPVLDGSSINQPMFGGYKPDAPQAERIGKIAKRLAACVRSIDTSRPVTGALAGVVMSNETEYPEAVDVVGYNYTENRYDTDHKKYPKRIIYGSETHSSNEAWQAVKSRDHIFGQFIWTGTDYLGESGRWPSRGLGTGLLDFASDLKPGGKHRAALWCEHPVAYLASESWYAEREGREVRVVCYTNAPKARLLLNGKVVGEMKDNDGTCTFVWNVPYTPGKLSAEGCDNEGRVIATSSIESFGLPYAITATADKAVLSADKATAHVFVRIVDREDKPVPLADNEITCHVRGAARLLGMENGSNSDMSDYNDNRHRVHNGRLLIYIQTIGKEGDVDIRLTSPLLKSANVILKVHK